MLPNTTARSLLSRYLIIDCNPNSICSASTEARWTRLASCYSTLGCKRETFSFPLQSEAGHPLEDKRYTPANITEHHACHGLIDSMFWPLDYGWSLDRISFSSYGQSWLPHRQVLCLFEPWPRNTAFSNWFGGFISDAPVAWSVKISTIYIIYIVDLLWIYIYICVYTCSLQIFAISMQQKLPESVPAPPWECEGRLRLHSRFRSLHFTQSLRYKGGIASRMQRNMFRKTTRATSPPKGCMRAALHRSVKRRMMQSRRNNPKDPLNAQSLTPAQVKGGDGTPPNKTKPWFI